MHKLLSTAAIIPLVINSVMAMDKNFKDVLDISSNKDGKIISTPAIHVEKSLETLDLSIENLRKITLKNESNIGLPSSAGITVPKSTESQYDDNSETSSPRNNSPTEENNDESKAKLFNEGYQADDEDFETNDENTTDVDNAVDAEA